MKCCCECHCGGIPSRDALNDRLYWVEVITGPAEGTKCAAWRNDPGGKWHWVLDVIYEGCSLVYADEGVRIIHEITPEE